MRLMTCQPTYTPKRSGASWILMSTAMQNNRLTITMNGDFLRHFRKGDWGKSRANKATKRPINEHGPIPAKNNQLDVHHIVFRLIQRPQKDTVRIKLVGVVGHLGAKKNMGFSGPFGKILGSLRVFNLLTTYLLPSIRRVPSLNDKKTTSFEWRIVVLLCFHGSPDEPWSPMK